ncbi:DUF5518 domain-containing protein [Haloferax larsenii]|uniref:DUF5518 domain-containing protein n=1 Tax=Haloferax larsenii TaxID=302484 RepID=UPI0002AF6DC9|nr:DUF5518 domain-containing protein [Haloferax larsenii]ELZ77982.1 hypothetical protein C455_09873 [Haloferax larsenii JCM 13917]
MEHPSSGDTDPESATDRTSSGDSVSASSGDGVVESAKSGLDDDGESVLFSALVGAVVSIVLSPLPGSTVLGGALAGYLTGTDRNVGVKAGALSGVFVSLVVVLFALVGFGFVSVFALVGAPRLGVGLGILGIGLVVLFGLVVALAYTVGLGALGGYLGPYLREEFQ